MTSTTVRAAAALSAISVALVACGASDQLSKDDAAQHAMDAVAREVRAPGSPIYHHQIAIRSVVPRGKGWLVRIGDRTDGSVICVFDLPEHSALGTRENLRIVRCASPLPPTEPGTTMPAGA